MSCLCPACIRSTFCLYWNPSSELLVPPKSLAERIVRYSELRPCTTAFIDTRTPGSDQKENFTIIGSGVSESPDQHVHIDIPHGFNLGAARQPPGCVNSQHSHDTAEVFIVHSGKWAFRTGHMAQDAEVVLGVGDTISIPTQVFRGFQNIGDDTGFMFAILGEDDPGRVTWAPSVFEAAEAHGLVLLENGQLVDRTKGGIVPDDVKPMPTTSAQQVASMRRLDQPTLAKCVVRFAQLHGAPERQVIECPIIGDNPMCGPLAWPHGFSLRSLCLPSKMSVGPFRRCEEQIMIVHRGELGIAMHDGECTLAEGDIATIPIDHPLRIFNPGHQPAYGFLIFRGDQAPPLESHPHAKLTPVAQ